MYHVFGSLFEPLEYYLSPLDLVTVSFELITLELFLISLIALLFEHYLWVNLLVEPLEGI